MTVGLNEQTSYTELLLSFPPRPIKTVAQLSETQKIIDEILDKDNMTENEQDYLNLLGTLVHEYEAQTVEISDVSGIEMLKVLIQDFGIRQKDLTAIFKTESIVSEVINGKRSLTVEHIQKLSQFFHVSPAAFFPA